MKVGRQKIVVNNRLNKEVIFNFGGIDIEFEEEKNGKDENCKM